ncbi:MAG: spermidine/putrescine ABC transporter substrate-binding protein [Rhizobiaceae bacterium]|nr:spermidine/putrescine ABC transporter substrate-binding protein [Rhizobiaceae bacterium]
MTTLRLLKGFASLAAITVWMTASASATEELNALVWCDHTDPALIEPFEKQFDAKVNLKVYEGTGAGLAIIEQSQPGDWDVLVIDGIDVPRAIDAGILGPLPKAEFPMTDVDPVIQMPEAHSRGNALYAVPEKYGYNTVSFNKDKVDPADMNDMSVLWGEKYKGRIAVYDYYLPVEGMVAMGLGKTTADLSSSDLAEIKETLFKVKENAKLVGDVVSSQTALATGEVDILMGGGEWVTAGLAAENPALDWVLPAQGGVRWSQSIGVFKDSKKPDLAKEFVKYIVSPEAQAKLATSSCYWAMPANKAAGAFLTDQQKAALRWDEQPSYIAKSQLYPAPSAELDKEMQDVWTEFLQR